jgi:HlyD family secretion protein
MGRQIFRQESLDRLSSPEELDRLFTVVGIRAWLPLAALGLLLVTAIAWSVFGRIPETADGAGVLINPGKVRIVQAPLRFGGQIVDLPVRSGHVVEKGETLAELNQPDLQQQLQQAEDRFLQAQLTDKTQLKLETERMNLERILRQAQIQLIEESIANIQKMTDEMTKTNEKQTEEQRRNLTSNQKETKKLQVSITDKLRGLNRLWETKLVTMDAVIGTESNLAATNLQLTTLDLKLNELEMKSIDNRQYVIQQKSRVGDLRIQLNEVKLKETNSELEISQAQAARKSGLTELWQRIQTLKKYLADEKYVKSEFPGRILELSVQLGQVTSPGARIGAMEVKDSAGAQPQLKTLAYFPLRIGKRIKVGMPALVTPATVERERHGSILGEVTRVSTFPVSAEAAGASVGSPEIVQALMQPGGMIEVEIKLELDPKARSGFRWTSVGPEIEFAAGITAGVRVTLEKRAPITYLFPILKSSMGGQ